MKGNEKADKAAKNAINNINSEKPCFSLLDDNLEICR